MSPRSSRSLPWSPMLMATALMLGCAAEQPEGEGELAAASSSLVLSGAETLLGGVSAASPLTVDVEQGRLRGKLVGRTREFLGIPYAQPPVGALRFAPPVPAHSWNGTRQALEFGPACPQPAGSLSAPGPQSEDCLTLNVFTPRTIGAQPRPVMVFIHGGAFVAGASSVYDAQKLSETGDVVVVTLNYRLGALGLLALPALDAARNPATPSGNDALRDQQLALAWVRANIDAFGGDAAKVTLFGESAGSLSTCLHMVSPESRDLADRFVMQSGACVGGMPISKKDDAHVVGAGLAAALCSEATDVVACLRAKPAAEVVAYGAASGISGAGWAPVINAADPFLPEHPIKLITKGNYNKGGFMVGSNANEWGLFQLIGATPVIRTVTELNAAIDAQFAELAPLVKLQYVTLSDDEANDTFVRLMTDAVFRCPARVLSRLTTVQGTPGYLYSFEQGNAYHAYDIPYVFGEPNARLGAPTLVEPLRATMQTYWTQFAKNGSPNALGQPYWPRYDLLTDRYMTLDASPSVGTGLLRVACDFWGALYLLDS